MPYGASRLNRRDHERFCRRVTSASGREVAANPDGILELIARDYGVSTVEVVRALPEEHGAILPGAKFEEVLQTLTEWEEVLFIVPACLA